MLKIDQEICSDGTLLLTLNGEATVETAEQLHQALLTGLNEQGAVQVDCSGTEAIDVYALQLLCSAHRTAVERKKSFGFLGPVSSTVRQTMEITGLLRELGCGNCSEDVACMWTGHNRSANA